MTALAPLLAPASPPVSSRARPMRWLRLALSRLAACGPPRLGLPPVAGPRRLPVAWRLAASCGPGAGSTAGASLHERGLSCSFWHGSCAAHRRRGSPAGLLAVLPACTGFTTTVLVLRTRSPGIGTWRTCWASAGRTERVALGLPGRRLRATWSPLRLGCRSPGRLGCSVALFQLRVLNSSRFERLPVRCPRVPVHKKESPPVFVTLAGALTRVSCFKKKKNPHQPILKQPL